MAKPSIIFMCQKCEAQYHKWQGRCNECGSWNSISEQVIRSIRQNTSPADALLNRSLSDKSFNFTTLAGNVEYPARYVSEMAEFDRVCGNGLVPGSVILVGGDPGIGKSTLLLQVAASLSKNLSCAYISGEEAVTQIKLRAQRMGLGDSQVLLSSCNLIDEVMLALSLHEEVKVLVVDSIQTMSLSNIDSSPGTVSQVRGVTQELLKIAKNKNIVVILVSHVTKDGIIAGPRLLEHMVDTVLYFEGERGNQFRILRTVKNRYGPTHEIGVFSMGEKGLIEVTNPSEMLLSGRSHNVAGNVVYAGIEGTRPLLVEIQALVAPISGLSPHRTVLGWELNRLSMIIAILEARCGVKLSNKDIYLNVVGGIKIMDTGADLAVALALISAAGDRPIPHNIVACGEVGLAAEVRSISQIAARLKEATKLGFTKAFIPRLNAKNDEITGLDKAMSIKQIGSLTEMPLKEIVANNENLAPPPKKRA